MYISTGGGRPGSADYNTLSDSIDDLQNSNNGSNRFDLLKLFWCAIPEIIFFSLTIFSSPNPNSFSNYVKNKKATAGMSEQFGNSSSPGNFKMGAEGINK